MDDRLAERGQRVTPLEFFFDLVVVFAITQVTSFLSDGPSWDGLLRGLLLLGALWWAWAGYAWLTNILDPEEGAVRLAMFAATASMLVVLLAVPDTFGANGVTFGVAYSVVRGLLLVLFAIDLRGRRRRDGAELRGVLRLAATPPISLPYGLTAPAGKGEQGRIASVNGVPSAGGDDGDG
jgi:low temperature requirement protein LtrA